MFLFNGSSHCLNFDKFRDTANLIPSIEFRVAIARRLKQAQLTTIFFIVCIKRVCEMLFDENP